MGFNFGAFAAGAIKGAGDVMEEQHKETKDTIDKNMKFAYEQGLPYHRQRRNDLRKFEGYASTLRNFQLSPDQVSAVMGKSESFIQDFIKNSSDESKATGGAFDVSSQITLPEGGEIRDWRGVHMGTVDLPQIEQPKQTANKSIFGSLMGTNDNGDSSGFNSLVDQTRSEMSSITGTSYNDVAAAAQGAYKYTQGTDSTINIVNTASQMQREGNIIQLDEMRQMSGMKYQSALWDAQSRVKLGERADETWEFTKLQVKWKKAAGIARFDSGIDAISLQGELDDIAYKTRQYKYGPTPEAGLYAIQLALSEEQMLDNPDSEKIAKLEKSKLQIGVFLGEMRASEKDANQTITFGQWNDSYESRVVEILALTIDPDNDAWYVDTQGVRKFDFSREQSKAAGLAAKAQAASEFIGSIREMNAGGRPNSAYLEQWMQLEKGFDVELTTLPLAPKGADEIDPAAFYAQPRLTIPVGSTVSPDKKTYQLRQPADYNEQRDGPMPSVRMPTFKVWKKVKGSDLIATIENRIARMTVVEDAAASAAALSAETEAAVVVTPTPLIATPREPTPLDTDLFPNAKRKVVTASVDEDSSIKAWWATWWAKRGVEVADAKASSEQFKVSAQANLDAEPNDNEIKSIITLYHTVRRGGATKMDPVQYRKSLQHIIDKSINRYHMEWAAEKLAELEQGA